MSREIKILILYDKLSFLEITNPTELIILPATEYREDELIIRDSHTREYKLSLLNNTEYNYTVYLEDTLLNYTTKIYDMIKYFKSSEYRNKLTLTQQTRILSVFIDDLNKEIIIKRKDKGEDI